MALRCVKRHFFWRDIDRVGTSDLEHDMTGKSQESRRRAVDRHPPQRPDQLVHDRNRGHPRQATVVVQSTLGILVKWVLQISHQLTSIGSFLLQSHRLSSVRSTRPHQRNASPPRSGVKSQTCSCDHPPTGPGQRWGIAQLRSELQLMVRNAFMTVAVWYTITLNDQAYRLSSMLSSNLATASHDQVKIPVAVTTVTVLVTQL